VALGQFANRAHRGHVGDGRHWSATDAEIMLPNARRPSFKLGYPTLLAIDGDITTYAIAVQVAKEEGASVVQSLVASR
jgi:hypothetical protein